MFHSALQATVDQLLAQTESIEEERRVLLGRVTQFIQDRLNEKRPIDLNFICTHNSRRSHLSQIWATVAAAHYRIPNVRTFSGGTEATAFNPRAVAAIRRDGFVVENPGGENPHYEISLGDSLPELECFSKTFDDPFNASDDFAAVMTCNHADKNCPHVPGGTRISLPYVDPKEADDTDQEASRYTERSHQIGTELLWAFSQLS